MNALRAPATPTPCATNSGAFIMHGSPRTGGQHRYVLQPIARGGSAMTARVLVVLALALVLPANLHAQDKSDEFLAKAHALVKKKLGDLKSPPAMSQGIEDKYVRET